MKADRRSILRLAAGTAAVGAFGIPKVSAASSDWPKPRYDSSNTATAPDGPGEGLEQDWSSNSSVVGTPIVADGTVYVADTGGTVRALDPRDGDEVWSFDAGGNVSSPVSYGGGAVYVTAGAVTYSLDASSGEENWRRRGTGASSSPANRVGDTVYVGVSSTLYALGSHTGTVLWEYDTGGPIRGAPAVNGGTVYVGSEDGNVHAVEAGDGFTDWRSEVGASVEHPPIYTDEGVIGVGTRGTVASFDGSGEKNWSENLLESVTAPSAADDDYVYVPTGDGSLHALRTSSGWEDWSFEADGTPTAPAVGGDTVYVCFGGTLYAIDAENGNEMWSQDGPSSSPVLAGDTVLFGERSLTSMSTGPAPAQTAVLSASVGNSSVGVGEETEVTAKVENTGESEGTHEATLYVDGEEEETRDVTVVPGGTDDAVFSVSFSETGEYELRVDETDAGTVEVQDETDDTAEQGSEETNETDTSEDDEESTGNPLPGFGAPTALIAAAVAAKRLLASDEDS